MAKTHFSKKRKSLKVKVKAKIYDFDFGFDFDFEKKLTLTKKVTKSQKVTKVTAKISRISDAPFAGGYEICHTNFTSTKFFNAVPSVGLFF